ncbi:hypothetical protein [Fluviibacter phosphoraccumulans]
MRLISHVSMFIERLHSRYELSQPERYKGAVDITLMANRYNKMQNLLERLNDEVEALDGTSLENEKIVNEYRALMKTLKP